MQPSARQSRREVSGSKAAKKGDIYPSSHDSPTATDADNFHGGTAINAEA